MNDVYINRKRLFSNFLRFYIIGSKNGVGCLKISAQIQFGSIPSKVKEW